jgi:hypothetical protein
LHSTAGTSDATSLVSKGIIMTSFLSRLCFAACCSLAAAAIGCSPASIEPAADDSSRLEANEVGGATFTWPVLEGGFAETFAFPIPWASELPYSGVAEVRWAGSRPFTTTEPTYFSYSFIWLLEDAAPFTANQLEADLTTYYRGLARSFDEAHFDPVVHRAQITAKKDGSYTGAIETVDPFNSSRPLELHVEGENVVCGSRTGVVLSLSPRNPGDAVWPTLSAHRHTFSCTK